MELFQDEHLRMHHPVDSVLFWSGLLVHSVVYRESGSGGVSLMLVRFDGMSATSRREKFLTLDILLTGLPVCLCACNVVGV